MRKLILHAGRHKTGTTTLQNFLYENSDLLRQHDFHYPDYGLNGTGHHEIGAAMTRASITSLGSTAPRVLGEHRRKLEQATRGNSSTLIISSEALQNCDPKVVRDFFRHFDTEVVIYLREEIGYLISSYAQKIQGTRSTESIEEYYESTFKGNYGNFVESWHRAFGNKLRLRIYERGELIRQDIVHDFMEGILRIDEAQINEHYKKNDANPTLTRALLEYKKAVNHCDPLPAHHARLLFNKLSVLARNDKSGKIIASQDIVNSMRGKFETSNRTIARKHFKRDHLFAPFQQHVDSDLPSITSSHFREIRAGLVKLSPELDTSLPEL